MSTIDTNPIGFLITTLFDLYLLIIAFRLIMQWTSWDQRQPIIQFIRNATHRPIAILQSIIPPIGRWDITAFVLLFGLTAIKFILLQSINPNVEANLLSLILIDIVMLLAYIYIISLIIEVILSWFITGHQHHPILPLLQAMNQPLLLPIRRKLPLFSGIDLSPMVAVIGIQFFLMILIPMLSAT
ncbi:MAG TPA: YggT family protein [Gammaproteobacteria bacterium]|nr:YggT family protein [Gammaproteobacteria bacterium]